MFGASWSTRREASGLPVDPMTTVIPLGVNGALICHNEIAKIKGEKLGLSDLSKGANSVEIRYWLSYPGTDSSQLLILRKQNKRWSGELINYTIFMDQSDEMKTDSIISLRRKTDPKSGWNHLVKNLNELRIKELPDMNQLPGQSPWFPHGNSVVVEIAANHTYKIYSYISPSELDGSHWEAKM